MEKFNEQKTKILRNLGLMLMFLGILITSSGELEAVSNVVYPTIGTMIVGLTTMCIGSIMFHKNEKKLEKFKDQINKKE
jgi:Na+-driven multidrug efflux pump